LTSNLRKGVFLDLETVDIGDLDRRGLAECLPRWEWHPFSEAADIPERIRDADVVITNKCMLDRSNLSTARGISLIGLAATGSNNVDLGAAADFGITVCNIRDYCSGSVAQHVITLMMNLLTGQAFYWRSVREGAWSDSRQFCLNGRPIREAVGLNFGVIGFGALGQAAAEQARGLGMEILVAERRGSAPRPGRLAFEEVLRNSDVLSVHCPLTDETRDLIGREQLQEMKPDALLINTARGGIVSEKDLADCLREGVIAGAGIDTLSKEPPPRDHPLLAADIPNLIVTPHNAWASRTARQAALDQLADIIRGYTSGMPLNVVA
jgi:glycerate dehydrogenase